MDQLRLLTVPMAGLMPLSVDEANAYVVLWGHRLGPCNRPFRQEAYAFEVDSRPVSVAISASIVSPAVAGYRREEVVECARLCGAPGFAWANRIMLRLWREVCAPRWEPWPVCAGVSYSQNAHHRGDLYRFDGWEKVREDCGSSGGGTWSRKRSATDTVYGKKTLWLWRYNSERGTAAQEGTA